MIEKLELPNRKMVYLAKCPCCGGKRSLNLKLVTGVGGITAASILTTVIFGGPLVGLFAVVGVMKLAMAGTIATGVAVKILQANYQMLAEINKEPWFLCDCGCSKIFGDGD